MEQSPKASPLGVGIGVRSPQIQIPRQDSSGTLKTTISLGRNPTIVQKGPFYLFKELPEPSEVNGSMNLIAYHGLQNAYTRFCGKKMKEDLGAFLSLPGNINLSANDDHSSLKSLIEKPPITNKDLHPLTNSQLAGFRLHPGQLPEQYRLFAPIKRKTKKQSRSEHEMKTGSGPHVSSEEAPSDAPKKTRRKEKERPKKPKKDKKKKKEKDKELQSASIITHGEPSCSITSLSELL